MEQGLQSEKPVTWWGTTIREVILKPRQFSCFNEADRNRLKLVMRAQNWNMFYEDDPALRECYYVAEKVIDGDFKDSVSGATHYKTIKCKAAWAEKMQLMAIVGNHEFFIEP